MSSNTPRDRHEITKVRRMARRVFNKLEKIKQKRVTKHSILDKNEHPRSSLDDLLWD